MPGFDDVHNLMKEIGPISDLFRVTEFDEARTWQLDVDDNTSVFADYDDELDKLTISADVATIDPNAKTEVYESLLMFNYQWEETGGLKMALSGPSDGVVLAYEVPVVERQVTVFHQILQNFVIHVHSWRTMLESGTFQTRHSESTPLPEPNNGIRV